MSGRESRAERRSEREREREPEQQKTTEPSHFCDESLQIETVQVVMMWCYVTQDVFAEIWSHTAI